MKERFKTGYVGLIGKPNTGKSTLMNSLIGEKLSITAHRQQTTRHQILGIKTTVDYQCIFVDTPGLHQNRSKAIHRYMNRAATSVLADVDLVCLLLDVTRFNADDTAILQRIAHLPIVIVVLNKIDQVPKSACLPIMQAVSNLVPNFEIIPVSALIKENIDRLEALMIAHLPCAAPQFPDDQLTDRSTGFMVTEIVREKLFRALNQEVPYSVTVSLDNYVVETDITRIAATIWVERVSQKAIVIGKGGRQLKIIGSLARRDIERLTDVKVYLHLWVKVREDWADDERSLTAFGYADGT